MDSKLFEEIYSRENLKKKIQSNKKDDSTSYTNRVINNFIDSVNQMNQIVLIPSKLRDIEVDPTNFNTKSCVPPRTDLYYYYNLLNSIKNNITTGTFTGFNSFNENNNVIVNHDEPQQQRKTLIRQNSEESNLSSMTSYNGSGSSSPSQSSPSTPCSSVNFDSGDWTSNEDRTSQLTSALMQHLHSLYSILSYFTNAAEYIGQKYQREVESDQIIC